MRDYLKYTCHRCDHVWEEIMKEQYGAVDENCPACGARHCSPAVVDGEQVREKEFWVFFIEEDVSPELKGPFKSDQERDEHALAIRREVGIDGGGIYWMNCHIDGGKEVGPYSGGFFEEVDNEVFDEECQRERQLGLRDQFGGRALE